MKILLALWPNTESGNFFKNVVFSQPKGLRLCEEADFGAQKCQHTTKFDARQNVQLTPEPALLQNRC